MGRAPEDEADAGFMFENERLIMNDTRPSPLCLSISRWIQRIRDFRVGGDGDTSAQSPVVASRYETERRKVKEIAARNCACHIIIIVHNVNQDLCINLLYRSHLGVNA